MKTGSEQAGFFLPMKIISLIGSELYPLISKEHLTVWGIYRYSTNTLLKFYPLGAIHKLRLQSKGWGLKCITIMTVTK